MIIYAQTLNDNNRGVFHTSVRSCLMHWVGDHSSLDESKFDIAWYNDGIDCMAHLLKKHEMHQLALKIRWLEVDFHQVDLSNDYHFLLDYTKNKRKN